MRVGIDFGGVIVRNEKPSRRGDTQLAQDASLTVAQDGVVEAVREIVTFCGGQVWIVSKAGPRMQARTRAWLDATNFFSQTGMAVENLHFCLERQQKERICRELDITHFIDDRIHIMQILRDAVPNLYLFGDAGGQKFCPPWATFVSSWQEFVALVIASIESE